MREYMGNNYKYITYQQNEIQKIRKEFEKWSRSLIVSQWIFSNPLDVYWTSLMVLGVYQWDF